MYLMGILKNIQVCVGFFFLDRNTLNHITIWKLFVLAKNTWNHKTVQIICIR